VWCAVRALLRAKAIFSLIAADIGFRQQRDRIVIEIGAVHGNLGELSTVLNRCCATHHLVAGRELKADALVVLSTV
jgi:hypothetical protein